MSAILGSLQICWTSFVTLESTKLLPILRFYETLFLLLKLQVALPASTETTTVGSNNIALVSQPITSPTAKTNPAVTHADKAATPLTPDSSRGPSAGNAAPASLQEPLVTAGLVTNSILFCWLFKIKNWCKKVRFQQTHNQGLRQLLLTVSWDLRAWRGTPDGVLVSL